MVNPGDLQAQASNAMAHIKSVLGAAAPEVSSSTALICSPLLMDSEQLNTFAMPQAGQASEWYLPWGQARPLWC
jgi:enamine deaminase RidA (YjgF/YER057c/UK114 family)